MKQILNKLNRLPNGIYTYDFDIEGQSAEIIMRKEVAKNSVDYWSEIASSHSIPVMDREVELFLDKIPLNGVILDVGGGYGWHWRNLSTLRPDVSVVILDMIKENLLHAINVIGAGMENIYLVEGNGASLIFDEKTFDGYWSVQTLQHIPAFNTAIDEAYRTLKVGGVFANYSLNKQIIVKSIYAILGKQYNDKEGYVNKFYLARASDQQFNYVNTVFGGHAYRRFSEIIYEPSLKITSSGRENSFVGWIDSKLSGSLSVLSVIARQQSFHTSKKH